MAKEEIKLKTGQQNKFKTLFGFEFDELKSWNTFVKLMNRPADPANLAIFRFLFGWYNFNYLKKLEKYLSL